MDEGYLAEGWINLGETRKQEGDIQDPYDLRGVTLKLLLFVVYLPKLASHPNK